MNRETVSYGLLVVAVILLILANIIHHALAILSAIATVMAYMAFRWPSIFVPYFTRLETHIKLPQSFEVTPDERGIVKKYGEDYLGTRYVEIDVYESMTNKSETEEREYARYFDRTIASVRWPFAINTVLYYKDMSDYVRKITEERDAVMARIAEERRKKKVDERKIELLEREKIMWERRLDSLYKNEKRPLEIMYYLTVSGRGPTKDAALSAADISKEEVKITFEGGLKVNLKDFTRSRMKICYDWAEMLPEW